MQEKSDNVLMFCIRIGTKPQGWDTITGSRDMSFTLVMIFYSILLHIDDQFCIPSSEVWCQCNELQLTVRRHLSLCQSWVIPYTLNFPSKISSTQLSF